MRLIKFFIIIVLFSKVSLANTDSSFPSKNIMKHIEALAGESGIGPRIAGSEEEIQAANFVYKQFESAGLAAEVEPFKAVFRGKKVAEASQNITAIIPGHSTDVFIIGAHYDSVPKATGSMGVIDNAASIALMIELAKHIQATKKPAVTVKFIAFGAEEVGLIGAKEYVKALSKTDHAKIIGMLNLDSITGGDNLYIHSALSKGYDCEGNKASFAASPIYRDRLLALAESMKLSFAKHPGNPSYPAGETGGWSDHAPFACAGIPIANIEATNFSLLGRNGRDGYSQTENANLWTCYDPVKKGYCDKTKEKQWGEIWHTQFDRLDVLNKEFPNRLLTQLEQSYELLTKFVSDEKLLQGEVLLGEE